MAEVRLSTLYKVSVTEHGCGVQRFDPDDTKYFTTIEEAEKYAKHWHTAGDRECYWRCTIEKVA